MYTLKPIDEILEPDPAQEFFVNINKITGETNARTFRDHYSAVESINLTPSVPDDIREHFDTARNLLLYSWFIYRFMPVAELHAYSTVEHALRKRSGKEKYSLKKLLIFAIKAGWIKDKGFRLYNINEMPLGHEPRNDSKDNKDVQAYCKVILDSMPFLRNSLAHGNIMLNFSAFSILAICADIINQIYEAK